MKKTNLTVFDKDGTPIEIDDDGNGIKPILPRTALLWFVRELVNEMPNMSDMIEDNLHTFLAVLDRFKEMEKKQIMDAYEASEVNDEITSEQYYTNRYIY